MCSSAASINHFVSWWGLLRSVCHSFGAEKIHKRQAESCRGRTDAEFSEGFLSHSEGSLIKRKIISALVFWFAVAVWLILQSYCLLISHIFWLISCRKKRWIPQSGSFRRKLEICWIRKAIFTLQITHVSIKYLAQNKSESYVAEICA